MAKILITKLNPNIDIWKTSEPDFKNLFEYK